MSLIPLVRAALKAMIPMLKGIIGNIYLNKFRSESYKQAVLDVMLFVVKCKTHLTNSCH